ncbi:MAG: DUF1175 family protein [Betaproteobacteria bacterium]|nr:DUF1175 family protein [Betaproteobacteria bacterium]
MKPLIAGALMLLVSSRAGAAPGGALAPEEMLDASQSRAFRAWMVRIVDQQIAAGPSNRWVHRDCAGLVRYAVHETLREHDAAWRRATGISAPAPPPLQLSDHQRALRNRWQRADGSRAAYVGALELVQENTTLVSRGIEQAQPGDLLFFDQGYDQHLMIWAGRYVAYHTGYADARDNGLRAVAPQELLKWKDSRWHPVPDNPNFLGVFRLRFLAR